MSTWGGHGGKWQHMRPHPALRPRDVAVDGVYETVDETGLVRARVAARMGRDRHRHQLFTLVELGTGRPLAKPKRAEDLRELRPDTGSPLEHAWFLLEDDGKYERWQALMRDQAERDASS